MSLHLHALSQLAASAPNPAPAIPSVGGGAVTTLLAWVKWLALAACAASAVVAGGMMAAGSTTRRSGLAERGKLALLWSVAGAVVVAIGIPLINQVFRLG
jgi:hypothetical protein